jgi:hypothetical protein
MAQDKKAIIVYADWMELFESLSNEEAGNLIKHFFRYVNDLNPEFPDRITELSFIPIKQSLKRDLSKWETKIETRSINGRLGNLKRWHPDLYKKVSTNKLTIEDAEIIANNRKTSHSDKTVTGAIKNVANIAVSVSDSVSVSVINKELIKILNSFLLSEIKISDDSKFLIFGNNSISITEKEKINFKTAVWFQKLFIKNLKEKNSPTTNQEKATYKNYVTPIRLMFENDNVTQEHVKQAYEFLNSLEGEFWKKNILSTESLRKQIQKLLIQKNTQNGKQFTSSTKKQARFSVARATETLRSDAERKQREMETRNS